MKLTDFSLKASLFFFFGTIGLISLLSASSPSNLFLQLEGLEDRPIEILLKSPSLATPILAQPDQQGCLVLLGLQSGRYELIIRISGKEIKEVWKQEIFLEIAQFLFLKIKWKESTALPIVDINDITDLGAQTVISQNQLSLLPSADNFSSVIENQDLSATTNRIDSGGLWADTPALFSSRGGASWTQNEFRLNGLNISEPFYGGTPLLLPDLMTIESWRHRNSLHPALATSPGGLIEIETKKGGPSYQGGIIFSSIEPWLTTSNITPSLREEGLRESHTFKQDRKFRLWASGPLASGNRSFYLSFFSQQLERNIADYDGQNQSRLVSGTFRFNEFTSFGEISLFFAGQKTVEEEMGAARKMSQEATLEANRKAYLAQFFWKSKPLSRQSFFAGLSLAYQKIETYPYVNELNFSCREIFRPIVWRAPLSFGEEEKGHLNFHFRSELLFGSPSSRYHSFLFGFDFSFRFYDNRKKIPGSRHLLFLEGQPFLTALFSTENQEKIKASDLSFYVQDTWHLSSYFIFEAGIKLIMTKGAGGYSGLKRTFGDFTRTSPSKISWFNWLPRFGLTIPLSKSRRAYFKFFYGQTAHLLPLNYLRWGSPEAEGCLIYKWLDLDGDSQLSENEIGPLLRRQGPFFARIDSKLLRPICSEFALSFTYRLSREFFLSLSGFTRLTRNLIETENIGVKEEDYEKFILQDIGDDRIPGTHDDLTFTIHNRLPHALGKDFFLLTNPDSVHRTSRYRGLDLVIVRRFSFHIFYFSFTATEAYGTTSPGNTEWENDEAIIGWLYDDPNSLINSRGRLRFDRAYTARLGFNFHLPGEFKAGLIAKYYDGQPFCRKIIVAHLNQGPIFIQAFPRGIARYEFNMTVDFRLEKSFTWAKLKSSLFLEAYNIFNQALATEENEWTSPEFPLRLATEIQSPRVFRLGLKLEF